MLEPEREIDTLKKDSKINSKLYSFFIFKSIAKFFNRKTNKKEITFEEGLESPSVIKEKAQIKTPEMIAADETVSVFISMKDYSNILKMLENGYILSETNKNKIQHFINQTIYKFINEVDDHAYYSSYKFSDLITSIELVNNLLKYDFIVEDYVWMNKLTTNMEKPIDIYNDRKSILNIFYWYDNTNKFETSSTKKLIKRNLDSKQEQMNNYLMNNSTKLNNILVHLEKFLLSQPANEYYFNIFKNHVLDINKRLSVQKYTRNKIQSKIYLDEDQRNLLINKSTIYINKHDNFFFKNIEFSKFMELFQEINNSSVYMKNIYDLGIKYYNENIDAFAKGLSKTYSPQYLKNLTIQKIESDITEMKNKILPEDINTLLTSITLSYNKIKSLVEKDDQVMLLETTNLFEKQLPDIIKFYLKLDEDKRYSLFNSQGRNAHELTLDSLNVIKDSYQEKLEVLEQRNISNLSALNKYTKSIR